MPFDGTDPEQENSAAIEKINEMIAFYSRLSSWTKHQFYYGPRFSPTALCLRGAINYAVCGDPVVKFASFKNDGRLWRKIHYAMKATGKKYYHTRSYIKINDRHLRNRTDAISFLRKTQNYLRQM